MPSSAFLHRMETVLAARVEEKVQRDSPRLRQLQRVLGVVVPTLVMVLVLKAAGLAHDARAFAPPPGADAGFATHLAHWLTGADPLSSTLAMALSAGPHRL